MTEEMGDEQMMSPEQAARFWQIQLEMSDKDLRDWHEYGVKVERRYKADSDDLKRRKTNKRFSILYSNTETIKSALYARTPKPDVRRRWPDRNPVARLSSEILERALSYCADNTKHDRAYRRGVQDMALPGRGIVWMVYEAEIGEIEVPHPLTMMPMPQEAIVEQEIREEYVYWQDFRWSPARCWDDVWWVARRHRMTREELRENFDDAENIPLNWTPTVDDRKEDQIPDDIKRSEVWEIWCKNSEARYWVVKGHQRAVRIDPDPYGLENFFPCAEPISAVLSNDTFVPCAFYTEYEDQAADLDEITARISILTKALKRRGVYDASVQELKRLARAGDNEFIAVKSYANLVQGGGLAKAFETEDISVVANVLMGLHDQKDRLIQAIYEITGISDIMRGATNPSETATAQSIKAQFGSNRMRDSQQEVQRWVRDTYRIKAELIAEHFEPQKLADMTGKQMDEQFMAAIQMIRQDKTRGYSIDIETDSTVFEDAEQEKQNRIELLTAMSQFIGNALPVVQQAPAMAPMMFEMLSFGVRGFKAGRQLEDVIDQTMQTLQQQMSQPQPPQEDPKLKQIEAQMQRDGQKHEMDMQGKVIDLQVHQAKASNEMQQMAAESQLRQQEAIYGPEAGSPAQ